MLKALRMKLLIFINENYSELSLFIFFFQNAREYIDFQEEFSDL
jgi:hypothetical protein